MLEQKYLVDKNKGSGQYGNYFEQSKGVTPNSRDDSDLDRENGGELKTTNGRTLMTLFTKTPEEKGVVRSMAERYAKDVGNNRPNPTLNGVYDSCRDMYITFKVKNSEGFKIIMDDENKMIQLINTLDSGMPTCTYKYSTILTKFKKKFNNGATLGFYSVIEENGIKGHIPTGEMYFSEIKSDVDILNLIRNGDLVIEINAWIQERKNKIYLRDRGVKFRVRKLDQIFKN